MTERDIYGEILAETERQIDRDFGEMKRKLEVRTRENPWSFLSIFKLSVPTHFKMIRAPGCDEIKLEDARKIFGNAYKAIINHTYYDGAVVNFEGPTDEYFFREGVRLARESYRGGRWPR